MEILQDGERALFNKFQLKYILLPRSRVKFKVNISILDVILFVEWMLSKESFLINIDFFLNPIHTSLNPFLITFTAVLLFIVVSLSFVNNCNKEQREQGNLESLHIQTHPRLEIVGIL